MNGSIFTGIKYFLEGFKLISKPGLRIYVAVPLIINIVIFSSTLWYGFSLLSAGIAWILAQIPSWLAFIEWILWPLIILTLGSLVFFAFNMVANIVASPFNGLLAEKTELYLIDQDSLGESGWIDVLKTIPASVARELHKLLYYLPRIILLSLLTLIPGINILASILVYLFASWMMAIQYIDYPMDNHKVVFKDMVAQIKTRNLSAIGFGAVVMLSLMIPVLNFVVIPAAVCGATLFWVKEIKPHN